MKCGYCRQDGHNRVKCPKKREEDMAWRLAQEAKKKEKEMISQLATEAIFAVYVHSVKNHVDK